MHSLLAIGPLAAVLLWFGGPVRMALAQDAAFAGRWRIASVAVAPWADPAPPSDAREPQRLVGRIVSFASRAVAGPPPLGCAAALYAVREDAPDMLFQGSLAEPDKAGRPRDAAALARGLGMTTPTVRTLATGCSEIEFHRLAADTLVFSLNDRIYTLHRAAAQAADHRLSCPPQAPAAWGAPAGPLERAAVLSEKAGIAIDESAPPSLVPDRSFARGKVWHNIWLMDDEPGWVHYVTCQYRTSSRTLLLPADGLRQCEQTAAPYDPGHGVANHAVQTLACH